MLTAYQVSTGAYVNEYGELFCPDCVNGDLDNWLETGGLTALSNYALDEEQTARWDGYEPEDIWGDEVDQHSDECVPALEDEHGHELVEAYHYGHKDGDE